MGKHINKRETKDWTGIKFGKWTVLYFSRNNYKIGNYWLCKCECGFTKEQSATTISNKSSKQCKKCSAINQTNFNRELSNTIWGKILECAKKRNIEVCITKDYCEQLYINQNKKCIYTGLDIIFSTTSQGHQHGESTASLDRIDSSKGYIEGNVQWIHKDIQQMKWCYSDEYFIYLCKLITNHKKNNPKNAPENKFEFKQTQKQKVKLTNEQVIQIRKEKSEGALSKDLAVKYNVTPSNICYIVNNLSRRDVK